MSDLSNVCMCKWIQEVVGSKLEWKAANGKIIQQCTG